MVWNQTKIMKDEEGYLRRSQVRLILGGCSTRTMQLLIKVLYFSGRRLSEVIGQPPYNRCPGLRLMDVITIEEEEPSIRWHILKKDPIKIDPKIKAMLTLEQKQEYLNELSLLKKPYVKILPTNKELAAELKEYALKRRLAPEQRLFSLSRFKAYYEFKKVCKNVGIYKVGRKDPHPHHLRHSFAVHISRKTSSVDGLRKLQGLLQHSDISITQHYLSVGSEDLRSTIDLMKEE